MESRKGIGEGLGTLGWALFFVWVGVAYLLEISEGLALIGVAAITLGTQALRTLYGLKLEGFWVVVGAGFALAGSANLYSLDIPVFAIVLIAVGVLIAASLLSTSDKEESEDGWGGVCGSMLDKGKS